MSHDARPKGHEVMRRFLFAAGLVTAGGVAVTWSWNTVVPNLPGLEQFRFAEGLSVAILALLLGALFETGRRLAGPRHTES